MQFLHTSILLLISVDFICLLCCKLRLQSQLNSPSSLVCATVTGKFINKAKKKPRWSLALWVSSVARLWACIWWWFILKFLPISNNASAAYTKCAVCCLILHFPFLSSHAYALSWAAHTHFNHVEIELHKNAINPSTLDLHTRPNELQKLLLANTEEIFFDILQKRKNPSHVRRIIVKITSPGIAYVSQNLIWLYFWSGRSWL